MTVTKKTLGREIQYLNKSSHFYKFIKNWQSQRKLYLIDKIFFSTSDERSWTSAVPAGAVGGRPREGGVYEGHGRQIYHRVRWTGEDFYFVNRIFINL